nr:redoxin domain-containing protein [Acidobacteriota bacterium]
ELVGQRKLGFDLLRDEENRFAEQLGLRFKLPDDLIALYKNFGLDLEASNGEAGWTLAMPARYVVDKTGTVRYAAVHPDYTKRPEPEETLEALRGL